MHTTASSQPVFQGLLQENKKNKEKARTHTKHKNKKEKTPRESRTSSPS
jgi:hypothetical protein